MNKITTIILLLMTTTAFGQTNCTLKLFDSYSFDIIQVNNSIEIKNADFSIDTLKNIISINKIKGNYLEIVFKGYDLYYEKLNIRKYKNDTISRQLIPKDSVILSRIEQIWGIESGTPDTLTFDNSEGVKSHILTYLKYLKVLEEFCDNGMRSYSNTYRHKILFTEENGVYKISAIDKLQPREYNCDELEKYLDKLKIIYPRFKLKEQNQQSNMVMTFTLMI